MLQWSSEYVFGLPQEPFGAYRRAPQITGCNFRTGLIWGNHILIAIGGMRGMVLVVQMKCFIRSKHSIGLPIYLN